MVSESWKKAPLCKELGEFDFKRLYKSSTVLHVGEFAEGLLIEGNLGALWANIINWNTSPTNLPSKTILLHVYLAILGICKCHLVTWACISYSPLKRTGSTDAERTARGQKVYRHCRSVLSDMHNEIVFWWFISIQYWHFPHTKAAKQIHCMALEMNRK